MKLPTLTILYWPATDGPGGFHGQVAGTRLQFRMASLDELSERAVELHQGLLDGSDLLTVALVPVGHPSCSEAA